MLKKSLVTVIGAASILGIGVEGASASTSTIQPPSQQVVQSQELVALPTTSDFNKVETKNESNLPSTRATFNISTSLGINSYAKSSNTFYINKGEVVTINSCTWNPSGQNIQIGFINAKTGTQYWTSNYSGGSISSGSRVSLGGPSGEYYVAVGTPSTNNARVNVTSQFKF
ncbi:hypothetical protein [Bacillus sp. SRB1LM]|uniref:hypothetical protein n=1 Tax=Bacillus sp. SRB1LM TaxID=2608688 RepID=UPI0018C3DAE0|nr:hypothetical protein [Bacillus sp. SRB1LM]MBG0967243.1 hypothetical protein [Bacillus sp. SRB1LM]